MTLSHDGTAFDGATLLPQSSLQTVDVFIGRLDATAAPHSAAVALMVAESAYAADADHLARNLLIGLLLDGTASTQEVAGAVERGLARFQRRVRLARNLPHQSGPRLVK